MPAAQAAYFQPFNSHALFQLIIDLITAEELGVGVVAGVQGLSTADLSAQLQGPVAPRHPRKLVSRIFWHLCCIKCDSTEMNELCNLFFCQTHRTCRRSASRTTSLWRRTGWTATTAPSRTTVKRCLRSNGLVVRSWCGGCERAGKNLRLGFCWRRNCVWGCRTNEVKVLGTCVGGCLLVCV